MPENWPNHQKFMNSSSEEPFYPTCPFFIRRKHAKNCDGAEEEKCIQCISGRIAGDNIDDDSQKIWISDNEQTRGKIVTFCKRLLPFWTLGPC